MTEEEERAILADFSTRRLVFEMLELAETRDPVDAANDAATVAEILGSRLDRMIAQWRAERAPETRV